MILGTVTSHYKEYNAKPLSLAWLTPDSFFVIYENKLVLHEISNNREQIIFEQEGALLYGLKRAIDNKTICLITSLGLVFYHPKLPPTFINYPLRNEWLSGGAIFLALNNRQTIIVERDSNIMLFTPERGLSNIGRLKMRNPICGCVIENNRFAFGSAYGEIEIFNLVPFYTQTIRRIHADSVQDIIAINSESVLTVSRDKNLYQWSLVNNEMIDGWSIMNLHDHFINCVSRINNDVWTGDSDGFIKVIQLCERQIINTVPAHQDAIRQIVLSPNGDWVITSSDDGTYKVINTKTLEINKTFGHIRNYIVSADMRHHNGKSEFILGKTTGEVILINNTSNSKTLVNVGNAIRSVSFLGKEAYACGLKNGSIQKYSMNNECLGESSSENGPAYSIHFNDKFHKIWCGRQNGQIDEYDTAEFKWLKGNRVHQSVVGDIRLLENGQIVSCSDDQTIKLLSASGLQILKTISFGSAAINNLIFTADLLLATTDDNKVFVLNRDDHSVLRVYEEHSASVRAVDILSNLVISGDKDGWLYIWDINSLKIYWSNKFVSRVIAVRAQLDQKIILVVTESEVCTIMLEDETSFPRITKTYDPQPPSYNSYIPLLLISALYKERDALLAKIEESGLFKEVFEGEISRLVNRHSRNTVAYLKGMGRSGNVFSRQIVEAIIKSCNPKLVVLFGIAAGIRGRVKIGDVLITDQVWDLRKCKIQSSTFEFEPRQINSSQVISLPFQISKLQTKLTNISPSIRVFEDLICGSSDNLIRSVKYMNAIAKTNRKLGAIDMESAGIADICSVYKLPFFIVRVISDYGDENKSDKFHHLSCNVAADAIINGFLPL